MTCFGKLPFEKKKSIIELIGSCSTAMVVYLEGSVERLRLPVETHESSATTPMALWPNANEMVPCYNLSVEKEQDCTTSG